MDGGLIRNSLDYKSMYLENKLLYVNLYDLVIYRVTHLFKFVLVVIELIFVT